MLYRHVRIIHLIGARCAGKTTIRSKFRLPFWDVLDFYRRHRCLADGMFIWSRVDKARIRLVPDLHRFLESCKAKAQTCLIESSGINWTLQDYLSRYGMPIAQVCLEPPSPAQLAERCKRERLPLRDTQKYNDKWMGKMLLMSGMPMLSQVEAIKRIKELI